jgi:hypothetical protein
MAKFDGNKFIIILKVLNKKQTMLYFISTLKSRKYLIKIPISFFGFK